MYVKCMTKRNRLVRKRNTSWNIRFPQSFRFIQYFFIFDWTMRFLTKIEWNLVQYSDAIQIESDICFIFFYSRYKTPGKNHHTSMYDTSFSYYIILRGLSQGWVWKTRNKIKLGNEDCIILFLYRITKYGFQKFNTTNFWVARQYL